jgi:hypothetical protein
MGTSFPPVLIIPDLPDSFDESWDLLSRVYLYIILKNILDLRIDVGMG